MFLKFRILLLLLVLATVALSAWRANYRLTAWEHSIHVAIYPIAGDNTSGTTGFIRDLSQDHFNEIGQWLQGETERHGFSVLQPVSFQLAPTLTDKPPSPPRQASPLEAILWSLQMRWWAWQHDAISGPKPDIRLFILYHDPEHQAQLPHSVGLGRGQVGVIHAFASISQRQQNAVVITHELLHTFGATDKYNQSTLQPLFPEGYAEPQRQPRLPQRVAEIMGGRIPLDEHQAEIPASLVSTIIGPETAREIGLLRP